MPTEELTVIDDTSTQGFEISVDEASYLVEHLDLVGRLPDVLALYNPMTGPDLAPAWKALQHQQLTERGILTCTGTLPEITSLIRILADADETLAIRVIPLHQPDTMLRVAIATRSDRFVVAHRTRDIVLAQSVPANDWASATNQVLATVLATVDAAPLTQPAHLSASELARIADTAAGATTDLLVDFGIPVRDAEILNAASHPDVATELTAARRVDGVTRRTTTAVTILDTEQHGRLIAWPHSGADYRTRFTYAPADPQRVASAVENLFNGIATY
jgi:hypothetical protein